VANDKAVTGVSARVMLMDQQGHFVAFANGQPPCNPSPAQNGPKDAPPVVIDATGDSTGMTRAQSKNLSNLVVILVAWTDEHRVSHQDSFYVPYTLGSDPARRRG